MPVRKVITRRSNHYRTYIPSLKNGRPTPCESMLEGMFIRLCEISPLVRSYEVQPAFVTLHINGGTESYVPDVRVNFASGTEGWFEVKPAARLKSPRVSRRMLAAKTHFAQSGRQFHVVTDEELNIQPRASNVLELMYHRRDPLAYVEHEKYRVLLTSRKPRTLVELCFLLGDDAAWRLLGLGLVGVDLEKPILRGSTIYLEGGHRHADLFA